VIFFISAKGEDDPKQLAQSMWWSFCFFLSLLNTGSNDLSDIDRSRPCSVVLIYQKCQLPWRKRNEREASFARRIWCPNPTGNSFSSQNIERKDESSETSLCDAYNLPQNWNTTGHICLFAFDFTTIENMWGCDSWVSGDRISRSFIFYNTIL